MALLLIPVFNNETIPEVPDNPDKPDKSDNPDNSGIPNDSAASKASGDKRMLSKTGDSAPLAPLFALAIGGLGLAVLCARRARME